MSEFLELAKKRFSCRKFKDTPVERDKLEKILEAGIIAPTAKNSQPFKIWVFESEEALSKVRKITPCHFNAPVIIAVGGDSEEAFTRPFDERNFEDVDASIIATHIMLEIQDIGLGSTWVGFFDEPELKKLFPEMNGYDIVALFPVGYPADDAAPTERHFTKKAFDELVSFK